VHVDRRPADAARPRRAGIEPVGKRAPAGCGRARVDRQRAVVVLDHNLLPLAGLEHHQPLVPALAARDLLVRDQLDRRLEAAVGDGRISLVAGCRVVRFLELAVEADADVRHPRGRRAGRVGVGREADQERLPLGPQVHQPVRARDARGVLRKLHIDVLARHRHLPDPVAIGLRLVLAPGDSWVRVTGDRIAPRRRDQTDNGENGQGKLLHSVHPSLATSVGM
jgi:hypothetical protein